MQPRDARNRILLLANVFLTREDWQLLRGVESVGRALVRVRRERQVGELNRYERRLANIYSEEVFVGSEEVFARGNS